MDIYSSHRATPPTILLDLDEVLADWVGEFVRRFQERYPHLPCVPQAERTDYNQNAYHPSPEERAAMNAVLHEPGYYAALEPIPGSRQAVREMRKAGFDVAICTKSFLSHATCASEKFEWVRRVHGQTMAGATTITSDKTRVLGDVLIDDHPAVTGKNETPAWTQLRFTRPHNAHLPGPRFDDWADWETAVGAVLDARSAA